MSLEFDGDLVLAFCEGLPNRVHFIVEPAGAVISETLRGEYAVCLTAFGALHEDVEHAVAAVATPVKRIS